MKSGGGPTAWVRNDERGFSVLAICIVIFIAFSTIAISLMGSSEQLLRRGVIKESERQDFRNLALEIGMVLSDKASCTLNLNSWSDKDVSPSKQITDLNIQYAVNNASALDATLAAPGAKYGNITIDELMIEHEYAVPFLTDVHLVKLTLVAHGHDEINKFTTTLPLYMKSGSGYSMTECVSSANHVETAGAAASPDYRTLEDALCAWWKPGSIYDFTTDTCVPPPSAPTPTPTPPL